MFLVDQLLHLVKILHYELEELIYFLVYGHIIEVDLTWLEDEATNQLCCCFHSYFGGLVILTDESEDFCQEKYSVRVYARIFFIPIDLILQEITNKIHLLWI